MDFAERDKCKPVPPRSSLAGNLEKPHMSLYGTEWRERGYGLRTLHMCVCKTIRPLPHLSACFTIMGHHFWQHVGGLIWWTQL
jgi:hypothetical protein